MDEIALDNPVFMQLLFGSGFANTQASRAIDIQEDTDIAWLEIANDIDLDNDGLPTGVVRGAAMRRMLAKITEPNRDEAKERALGLIGDLHAMGVTGIIGAAGSGLTLDFYDAFESLDEEGRLKLRSLSLYSPSAYEPAQERALTDELGKLDFFQESSFFQRIGVGERLYNPIHDSMLQPAANSPEHKKTFTSLARQVAAQGRSLQQHATHPASMQQQLDAYEEIKETCTLEDLRWAFHHADGIDEEIIERTKAPGMGIASHSRRLISGNSFNHPCPCWRLATRPCAHSRILASPGAWEPTPWWSISRTRSIRCGGRSVGRP